MKNSSEPIAKREREREGVNPFYPDRSRESVTLSFHSHNEDPTSAQAAYTTTSLFVC